MKDKFIRCMYVGLLSFLTMLLFSCSESDSSSSVDLSMYVSSDYDFEVGYPSSWTYSSTSTSNTWIDTTSYSSLVVSVPSENTSGLTLDTLVDSSDLAIFDYGVAITTSSITMDGQNGILYSLNMGVSIHSYITIYTCSSCSGNEYIYQFTYSSFIDSDNEIGDEVFETFNFTDN